MVQIPTALTVARIGETRKSDHRNDAGLRVPAIELQSAPHTSPLAHPNTPFVARWQPHLIPLQPVTL